MRFIGSPPAKGKPAPFRRTRAVAASDQLTCSVMKPIFERERPFKVEPGARSEDDPYADPRYQVPDDLVW